MCKARFHVVTRLRDKHVKRFRGIRQHRPVADQALDEDVEEETVEIATVCMLCGNGDHDDQLMLCDGEDCDNVSILFFRVCVLLFSYNWCWTFDAVSTRVTRPPSVAETMRPAKNILQARVKATS